MIKLIKNEFIKIFHKKSIYVFLLLIFLYTLLSVCIIDNAIYLEGSIDDKISQVENRIKNYNVYDEYERKMYISDMSYLESLKAQKRIGEKSFKAQLIQDKCSEVLYGYVEAKLNHNSELEEMYKKDFEAIYDEIASNDYLYFYNKDKKQVESYLKELEEKYNNSKSDIEKNDLKKEIDYNKVKLYTLNTKIDNKLDPDIEDNKHKINIIDDYIDIYENYQNSKKDRKLYDKQDEYESYLYLEKEYYTYKYMIENNDYKSLDETLTEDYINISNDSASLIVIVIIAMVVGSLISEEFNKGTIKQLLVRPHSRFKIFVSKFIAASIFIILFCLLKFGIELGIYSVFDKFKLLTQTTLVYNYGSHEVLSVNIILYNFLKLLCHIPQYIIVILFSLMISLISLSSSVSVATTVFFGISGDVIRLFLTNPTKMFLKYMPFNCWNFNEYLYGNIPDLIDASLSRSLLVCLITTVLLFTISITVFKKRNIKNQ